MITLFDILFVPDIAIKLGKRDVSELSPTDIAIEVLSNFYLYFLGSRQTEKFLGAIVESEFCLLISVCILQALDQIDNFLKGEGDSYAEC